MIARLHLTKLLAVITGRCVCRSRVGTLAVLLLCVSGLLMSGCSLLGDSPTRLKLALSAAEDINPDLNGRPSPVVLRLYELKDPSTFETADFFSLYQPEPTVSKDDVLAFQEVVVKPGAKQVHDMVLHSDAGYIGLVAAFRDIEQATWRVFRPLKRGKKNRASIMIERLSIRADD